MTWAFCRWTSLRSLPPIDDDTEDDDDKVFLTEKEFSLLRLCMHEDDRDFLTVACQDRAAVGRAHGAEGEGPEPRHVTRDADGAPGVEGERQRRGRARAA